MKQLLAILFIAGATAVFAAPPVPPAKPATPTAALPAVEVTPEKPAIAVRNPFWPIGYEGERTTITAEAKIKVKQQGAAAEGEEIETSASTASSPEVATPQHWIAARKSLKIGGRVIYRDDDGNKKTSVIINGNAYADDDLISITMHGRRFTWEVKGLSEGGVLKLVRVKARRAEAAGGAVKKGNGL